MIELVGPPIVAMLLLELLAKKILIDFSTNLPYVLDFINLYCCQCCTQNTNVMPEISYVIGDM